MNINTALAKVGLKVKPKERPSYLYRDAYGYETQYINPDEQISDEKLQQQAMACAWVYSDVTLLARKEKQANYHVVETDPDGNDTVIDDHPLTRLLVRPNELMSGGFLKEFTSLQRNLTGNAYWWLATNAKGELVEIWPLRSCDIEPVRSKKGSGKTLAGYYYKPMRQLLPVEMICHFRLANPDDPLNGLSPLSALRLQITGDRAMWSWNTNFFDKKNAIPTAVISLPAETEKGDFARIREHLYNEFGNAQRRAAVTRAGELDVKVIGMSQKDMEFLAGIKLNRETIDRVFGIPSAYWAETSNRATSDTAELIVMRDTVQPAIDYQASEIDAQIVDRYYEAEHSVKADNLVPEDRELKLQEYRAKERVLTVDEAREEWGKEPLGGELGETLTELVPSLGRMMSQSAEPAALPAGEQAGYLPNSDEQKNSKSLSVTDVATNNGAWRELQLWRKVAIRAAANGKDAGKRHFESECIAPYLKARIEAGLEGVTNPERVKAVFEAWV